MHKMISEIIKKPSGYKEKYMRAMTKENVLGSMLHMIETGYNYEEMVFIAPARQHIPYEIKTLLEAHQVKIKRTDFMQKGNYIMTDEKSYEEKNFA